MQINALMTQGRVNDFTLSVFMANLWVNSVIAFLIFALFFFGCRLYRQDKEKFLQKLHRMSVRSSDTDQEEEDEHENLIKLINLDESRRLSNMQGEGH